MASPPPCHPESRISLHLSSAYHWDLPELVHELGQCGLHNLGMWRLRLEQFGEERCRDLLSERGIQVSSLSWAGGFTGQHGISIRETLHDAGIALDSAAALGAPYLLVVTGTRAGHSRNHVRRLLTEQLSIVAENAQLRGVAVLVHVLNGARAARWSCLDSTTHALDLVQGCQHSRLGLAVDLHGLMRDPVALERLEELVPHMGLAILRDIPRVDAGGTQPGEVLPGPSTPSLAEVVRRLEAAGYRGQYELHLPHQQFAPVVSSVLLRHCRSRLVSWLACQPDASADLLPIRTIENQ
ncbi:MAG: sugar phosphate isomerase/epimerase family protein [Planctomycetaceae bacterium]